MGAPKSCSGPRATVLLLGAWLSAAAITTGCYSMNGSPPRDSESKRARRVLKRHLAADLPFARLHLTQLPFTAPGYRLFAGEDPTVRDEGPSYWVVRDDGGVVTTDPHAELAHAYRSLEVAGPEPLASPEELAWLAVALLEHDVRLFDRDDHRRLDVSGPGSLSQTMNERYELAPPQLVRQGDAVRLVFLVYTTGRRFSLLRYELQITADYEVTVSRSSPPERAAITPP